MKELNIINKKIKSKIKISVVITTYNRAQSLKKTIQSIINQTEPVFEIIVVDDGSTDCTKQVVDKFDYQIKYIYCKNNGRPSVPRNLGAKNCKGNYIAFCDDDDTWDKNKIKIQVSYINRYQDKVKSTNAYHLIKGYKSKTKYFNDLFFYLNHEELFFCNKIILSSILIEKNLFELYTFDESKLKKAVEDYDLWLKISKIETIINVNQPLVFYETQSPNKISIENVLFNFFKLFLIRSKFFNLNICILMIRRFFKKFKYSKNDFKKYKDLISVIMPVYNSDKYLKTSIDSILNQSYKNFEFLILDDGSTDRSYEILKEYQKQDNRIKIYRNKNNYGISYSLNKLIKHTKGDYIARMDSDDFSIKDRLNIQLEYMKKNKSVDLLSSGMKCFGKSSFSIALFKNHDHIKFLLPLINIINHPTVFIRKSNKIDKLYVYESKYDGQEDWYLWNQLIDKISFFSSDQVVLEYRTYSKRFKNYSSYNKNKSLKGNNTYNDLCNAIALHHKSEYKQYKTYFLMKNIYKNFKDIRLIDFIILFKFFVRRILLNKFTIN